MIPLLSRILDSAVDRQFRKDPGGRLVFVPFSLSRKCYFVDSKADEEKIRALVRMYRGATTVIPLVIYPIIMVPGFFLDDYAGLSPRGHRLAIAIGIPLYIWLILIGFLWMLWSLYKRAIPGLTASLSEVGPGVKGELREFSQGVRSPVLAVVAVLLLIAAALIAFLTSYHPPR
jgi:hypothetical protein